MIPHSADDQAEMNLRTQAAALAEGIKARVEEFCQLLRGRCLTAKQVEALRPEWASPDHRQVRLLAAASNGRVLSWPGSPGYRLTAEVAEEELAQIEHGSASLISQGREMIRKGLQLRRIAGARQAARTTPETATTEVLTADKR